MNLLISDLLPADVVLDRAIPWMDDFQYDLATLAADDEPVEHAGRIVSSAQPAWYELRLSMLRQVIMDAF